MAGASSPIDIQVDDAELRAELKRLAAKLNDLKPFFNDVGETLLNSTRERFKTQTDPFGRKWKDYAPLSLAYRARKPQHKDLILTLNGYLRGTLTKKADQDSLRIGTPMVYGAVHQFGAKRGAFGRTRFGVPIPWGDIPARPFLGLSEDDRADLLDALNEYLAK